MHYSGVLVRSRPSDLERCALQIDSCVGVETYVRDPSSASLIAVVETETLDQQETTLRALQDLPSVITACLVYHYFDEAPDAKSEVTTCLR